MRQPDPRVASSPLDDRPTGLQQPLGLCILDQEQRGPILDTAAGRHEFRLGENVASRFVRELGETDEGRVPYGTDEPVDFRAGDGEARNGVRGRCHGADEAAGGEAVGDGSERGLEHFGWECRGEEDVMSSDLG